MSTLIVYSVRNTLSINLDIIITFVYMYVARYNVSYLYLLAPLRHRNVVSEIKFKGDHSPSTLQTNIKLEPLSDDGQYLFELLDTDDRGTRFVRNVGNNLLAGTPWHTETWILGNSVENHKHIILKFVIYLHDILLCNKAVSDRYKNKDNWLTTEVRRTFSRNIGASSVF